MAITIYNPYIVGGVVRGNNFYGRADLIDGLLAAQDTAIWVIGNRRIGKTSLLIRVANQAEDYGYMPFRMSLEGCDTGADFTAAFCEDLDGPDARLRALGLTVEQLAPLSPPLLVRTLDQHARATNQQVLLLIDEAEALIGMAEQEGDDLLKDMRRAFQRSERIKLVLAATRRLMDLNKLTRHWDTSPFLFDVRNVYLGGLGRDDALALVRQAQHRQPLAVESALADAIIEATGGHPYLTQWLCAKLWGEGVLRVLDGDDLVPDQTLAYVFQYDYDHLASMEQHLMRTLAGRDGTHASELHTAFGTPLPQEQQRFLVQALVDMCYLRERDDIYSISNQMMRNWLQFAAESEPTARLEDRQVLEHTDANQRTIHALIATLQQRQELLEQRRAHEGIHVDPSVIMELNSIAAEIQHQRSLLERPQRGSP